MIHKLACLKNVSFSIFLTFLFLIGFLSFAKKEPFRDVQIHAKRLGAHDALQQHDKIVRSFTSDEVSKAYQFQQLGEAYQARNLSQQYNAEFTSNGLEITPINTIGWSHWALKNTTNDAGDLFLLDSHTVCYSRGESILEWYKHTSSGIEQGITIQEKTGFSDELHFSFQVAGDLNGKQVDRQTILFFDSQGEAKLKYEKLIAFDANGKNLLASLSWGAKKSEIHWRVNTKGAVYPITIDPLITTFTKRLGEQAVSNGGLFFNFGDSLALDGNQLVVGAQGEGVDNSSSKRGAAYVYYKNSGGFNNWGLRKKINAPDFSAGDNFGSAVGISGEYLAVGARWADPANISNAGKVYLFKRDLNGADHWGHLKTFIAPDPLQDDNYGRALMIKGDLLFIGMPQFANTSGSGKVFVYKKDQGGLDNWGLLKTLSPLSSETNADFGASLALENDVLIVGKPGLSVNGRSGSGGVSIYRKDIGGLNNWGLDKAIVPSVNQSLQNFGNSVDIQGNEIIVGASGYSKPINSFQSVDFVGAAYVFEKDLGGLDNWGQLQQLLSSDGAERDAFGSSVKLLGGHALVGAVRNRPVPVDPQFGAVYLYEKTEAGSDAWTFKNKLFSNEGGSLAQYGNAIVGDEKHLVVSARSADIDGITSRGAAYVYRLQNSLYNEWLANNFSSQELAQSNLEETLWGITADPDGDSVVNIEEAYFNTDPRALSTTGIYANYQNHLLSMNYSLPLQSNGVSVTPLWSKNLLQWHESGQGPGSDIRDLEIFDSSGMRKIELNPSLENEGFIRLRYTQD